MGKRALRSGAGFADRPTEWTAAVVGIITAVIAYANDRDLAALIAAAGGFVPVIVTAIAAWWERGHATTEATVPTVG